MNELSEQWTLMYQKRVGDNMVYTYSYNDILAPQETTAPLFQSVTFANVVEGQLEESQLDIPVNFYAIQSLNTGEGSSVVEQAADAWLKYVNQNDGQAGEAAAPLSLSDEQDETEESQAEELENAAVENDSDRESVTSETE